MNRNVLRQNDILFQEIPVQADELPRHLVALFDALLDFQCTESERNGLKSDREISCFLDQPYALPSKLGSLARVRDIKKEAEKLYRGKDREAEWQTFFFDHSFKPFANETKVKNEDLRRDSRIKFYYDYFEHAQGRPWTLFGKPQRFREAVRKGLTEPKTDWVAFYPIYDFTPNSEGRIPTSDRWGWYKAPVESIVENFSSKILDHLAQHGLESNTAGVFRKGRKDFIVASDCICFPWLIVEHKKSCDKELQCYCQAANAGAGAVMMLQTLSRYAEKKKEDAHIPPVVTMTTVGKSVRVWVVYSRHNTKEFKMDCIWQGDMAIMMDLIKLQAILENLHTWAMRVLRPWISSYIDQWRAQFPVENRAPSGSFGEENGQSDDEADDDKSVNTTASSHSGCVEPSNRDNIRQEIFREILQTEHIELVGKLELLLKESIHGKNSAHPSPRPTCSVGTQTMTSSAEQPTWHRTDQTTEKRSVQKQVESTSPKNDSNSDLSSVSTSSPASPKATADTTTTGSGSKSPKLIRPSVDTENIFEKRARMPWRHKTGKLIYVKLPDVSSKEIAKSKPGLVKTPRLRDFSSLSAARIPATSPTAANLIDKKAPAPPPPLSFELPIRMQNWINSGQNASKGQFVFKGDYSLKDEQVPQDDLSSEGNYPTINVQDDLSVKAESSLRENPSLKGEALSEDDSCILSVEEDVSAENDPSSKPDSPERAFVFEPKIWHGVGFF